MRLMPCSNQESWQQAPTGAIFAGMARLTSRRELLLHRVIVWQGRATSPLTPRIAAKTLCFAHAE